MSQIREREPKANAVLVSRNRAVDLEPFAGAAQDLQFNELTNFYWSIRVHETAAQADVVDARFVPFR